MKLYYSPGACSLSPHIVLREAGFDPTLIPVNLGTKKAGDGRDYLTINSKGYVPALELDDGQVLTEGPAIVQYVADRVPEKNLAPKNGTMERYRLQEWLNFIATELHKGFGPLFNPELPDAAKAIFTKKLGDRLAWVDKQLAGKDYLMGKNFSVADAYLFTVTGWGKYLNISIDHLPNLSAFMARMGARPAVQAALKAEKLKD
ncbi:MAG: glutathione transferase GstA [Dongiaceae bacterium]